MSDLYYRDVGSIRFGIIVVAWGTTDVISKNESSHLSQYPSGQDPLSVGTFLAAIRRLDATITTQFGSTSQALPPRTDGEENEAIEGDPHWQAEEDVTNNIAGEELSYTDAPRTT
ncbi:hypothetical protein M422DRAFT_268300 [Sphaerobolus stellatus SS14]|uniref:Uncharacterized protein n=1 Tax=Sphaerobolus stellatus (strain SS14) TaxID=990650 RepID=A0A0C9UXQ4_SPHS4|nr:hypothetical protein M422DRAFT_268300 [Sphaerobolus stellatus SS14]